MKTETENEASSRMIPTGHKRLKNTILSVFVSQEGCKKSLSSALVKYFYEKKTQEAC